MFAFDEVPLFLLMIWRATISGESKKHANWSEPMTICSVLRGNVWERTNAGLPERLKTG